MLASLGRRPYLKLNQKVHTKIRWMSEAIIAGANLFTSRRYGMFTSCYTPADILRQSPQSQVVSVIYRQNK